MGSKTFEGVKIVDGKSPNIVAFEIDRISAYQDGRTLTGDDDVRGILAPAFCRSLQACPRSASRRAAPADAAAQAVSDRPGPAGFSKDFVWGTATGLIRIEGAVNGGKPITINIDSRTPPAAIGVHHRRSRQSALHQLHFEDTRKLLDVLKKLVDQGNTIVVIEHDLDVIKTADSDRLRAGRRRRRRPHRRGRHAGRGGCQ